MKKEKLKTFFMAFVLLLLIVASYAFIVKVKVVEATECSNVCNGDTNGEDCSCQTDDGWKSGFCTSAGNCRLYDTSDGGSGGGGGGGGGANGAATNLKCNCTADFGACGDKFGKTDIQWRQCTFNVNGAQTCNWHVGPTLYQWKACEAGPTVTPGGPTLTPTPTGTTPTPTDNPNCGCLQATKTCRGLQNANACSFEKFSDITTYQNPIKCGVANNKFQSNPTNANKDAWCRAEKKTKGDADLNGVVNLLDYFYFIHSKIGAKVPATVNPDFNGDNQIDNDDSAIIIKTLKTGGF